MHGLGPLGTRLAGAFVAVALVALALFAALTLAAEGSSFAALRKSQLDETSSAALSVARSAYQASHGWAGADLAPLEALADLSGARIALDDPAGVVLFHSGAVPGGTGARTETRAVVSGGRVVGEVRLDFPDQGLSPAEQRLRSALARSAALAGGLGVLTALVVSVVVTRRLVRPLRRLSAAARAVGAGDRSVRLAADGGGGPGELGELGAAFDAMSVAIEHQEQLRKAMVADVAHELRTPLAVLRGETEALVDGVREAGPEALTSLHDEVLRLGRMVDDLQSLASADAAGLSLVRRPVDLARVAARSADALDGRFSDADVSLGRELSPVAVLADPERLAQVVTNLLANAVKFTPAGGAVRLVVGAERGRARLEVADTGPGVPPDERDKVFDRFFRGSAGRGSGGSGIGLAVVKQLVEAHGGEVRLESPAGGGALFVVVLPVAEAPPR